jgi:hypothetical protein
MEYWYLLFGSAYLGGCLAAPTGFASPVASARWQCSAPVKGAGSKEPTTAKCRATTSGGGWWHGCLATLWLALADGIWWGGSRTATLRAGAERLHDEHQLSTGRRSLTFFSWAALVSAEIVKGGCDNGAVTKTQPDRKQAIAACIGQWRHAIVTCDDADCRMKSRILNRCRGWCIR